MKKLKVDTLKKYLDMDNFPKQEWGIRGLIPSSSVITKELNTLFLEVVQNLINSYNLGSLNRDSVLDHLNKLSLEKFDTEEKELFIDKLILIFTAIESKKVVEEWLRNNSQGFVVKNHDQVKVTKQKCLRCQNNLINWILKADDQDYPFWEIGKCNECGKLNLIRIDKANSFEPKTFDIVRSLRKKEYTEEAALNEIERIEKGQNSP